MPRSVTSTMKAPVLDAYVLFDGQAAIWCRYCLQWHVHATKEGLQVAICGGASPYGTCGYYLQLIAVVPEIEAAIAKGLPPRHHALLPERSRGGALRAEGGTTILHPYLAGHPGKTGARP